MHQAAFRVMGSQQPQPQLLLLQPQLLLLLLPQQQQRMRMRIMIQQQPPSKHPFISHNSFVYRIWSGVSRAVHSTEYDLAGNV